MNKKSLTALSLLCALVVSGCTKLPIPTSSGSSSQSTSSEVPSSSMKKELNMEAVLASLQAGVKLSVTTEEEDDNSDVTIYNYQTAVNDDAYSYIWYNDESRSSVGAHETYVRQEGSDLIYATRLDVSNTLNHYRVYNPATYEYYKWSDGYENPFKTMTADSFIKVDDTTYKLNDDACAASSNGLSSLFYTNPGLTVKNLKLSLVDDELHISGKMEYGSDYTYKVNATVLAMGEGTDVDHRAVPFAEVEDAEFDAMVASLKAKNYSSYVEIYEDDELIGEALYASTEDGIFYATGRYAFGYYELGDGIVQEVEYKNGAFYKTGTPEEGDLDEIRPTFNISRACFDQLDDGTYKIKDGVEGDMFICCVFELYPSELANLTIKISDDGYVFTNSLDSESSTVSFYDVGSTQMPFDADSVLDPVPSTSTTWSDVLDSDSYAWLENVAGDAAASIPVPEGYDEWYQISEEEDFAFLAAVAGDSIDDDIYAYYMALVDAGFYDYGEGPNGGYLVFIPIDDSSYLGVEFLEYEGMFCVLVYIIA